MHHSTLGKLGKRFGIKGAGTIDSKIFNLLKITTVIDTKRRLINSTPVTQQ